MTTFNDSFFYHILRWSIVLFIYLSILIWRTLILMAVYIFSLCKFNRVLCAQFVVVVYTRSLILVTDCYDQTWIIIIQRVWLLVVLPFCHYDRLKRLHWIWTPLRILKPFIYMLLLLHSRVQQNILSRSCCSVLVSIVRSSSPINCLIVITSPVFIQL